MIPLANLLKDGTCSPFGVGIEADEQLDTIRARLDALEYSKVPIDVAEVERLRDALRAVMRTKPPERIMWCTRVWHLSTGFSPCGECPGCLAWQAAQDALKEVGDAE